MKILYVVHRYFPFPGGSEYYVRDLAEETLKQGHDVTVFASTNKGDQNGVKVTDDPYVLAQKWDLIVVHGGDVISPDIVHAHADHIKSPVMYMIIKPSESDVCLKGLALHKYLAWSTSFDLNHIIKHGMEHKAVHVRHSIVRERSIGGRLTGISMRGRLGIKGSMYVTAGGFWPHKGMKSLAASFNSSELGTLLCFGYEDHGDRPQDTNKVMTIMGAERELVLDTIAEADGYILNSSEEGFGLVLLESMINKTPWFGRDLAGAHEMQEYGHVYDTEAQLITMLSEFRKSEYDVETPYNYTIANRLTEHTVSDILSVFK